MTLLQADAELQPPAAVCPVGLVPPLIVMHALNRLRGKTNLRVRRSNGVIEDGWEFAMHEQPRRGLTGAQDDGRSYVTLTKISGGDEPPGTGAVWE